MSDCYEITYVNGTLQVTRDTTTIWIASVGKTWEYDGQAHTNHEYTVRYGSTSVSADASGLVFTLPTSDDLTIVPAATATITDAGSVNNGFTFGIQNNSNYSSMVILTMGDLKVTPVALTIRACDSTKVYDGQWLTRDTFRITSGALATTDKVGHAVFTGARLLAGDTANVLSGVTINRISDNADVTSNYDVTYVNGTLKVTPAAAFTATGPDTGTLSNVTAGLSYAVGGAILGVTTGTLISVVVPSPLSTVSVPPCVAKFSARTQLVANARGKFPMTG